MKTPLIFLLLASHAFAQDKIAPPVGDPGWPREINRDGVRLVYYPPQIDEWRDYRSLRMRVAFSLTPKDGSGAVGVAELEGRTIANLEQRTVSIENLKITTARFPSAPEGQEPALQKALLTAFPGKSLTVALDRIVTGLEGSKDAQQTVELKMDPPQIFTSTGEAMLLLVDGEPVRAPLEGTGLEFVVNTNWNLFFDPATTAYFLLADKTWLTAAAFDGEWKLATNLPAGFSKMPKDASWDAVRKATPPKVAKGMKVPKVIYSAQPAELIAFKGTPVFEKIAGTRLLWAKNTESWVFQDSQDQQMYFLVSGRWFRSAKLEGPWTYAGNDLPKDFEIIPTDHPCSDVLASVPGTPEAEDAVLLAQVPVEATVTRADAEAKAKVSYGGEPKFESIEGTTMTYATNTTSDVIKVENNYYLCQDAVWFSSAAPIGPWLVTTTVPIVIYSIPARYPVHRVTYVKVEAGNSNVTVVCSYTAGYYGAFVTRVAVTAALVYGTGWYYPPYIYHGAIPIYRPWGATYGCAAAYNPWTGGYVAGGAVYGPYGSAGRAAWYNPATGNYGRAATVQGPYGGRTVAAGYNPRTDTGWATRQGNNGYAQWGTSAVSRGDEWVRGGHIATEEGGVARWKGSEGAGKVKWTEDGAKGVAYRDDNLYAGKDGNVYRRDEEGDWAKYDDGGWEDVDKPNRKEPSKQSAGNQDGKGGQMQKKPQDGKTAGGTKESATDRKPAPKADTMPVERKPSQGPAKTAPAPEVMTGLKRESTSRGRGDYQAARQGTVERSGTPSSMGGSRKVNSSTTSGGAAKRGSGGGGARRR